MSCPNCFCSECEKEREKWQRRTGIPSWAQPLPQIGAPYTPAIPNKYMCMKCGQWYEGSHACMAAGETTTVLL